MDPPKQLASLLLFRFFSIKALDRALDLMHICSEHRAVNIPNFAPGAPFAIQRFYNKKGLRLEFSSEIVRHPRYDPSFNTYPVGWCKTRHLAEDTFGAENYD
jgi:hypothetical protein